MTKLEAEALEALAEKKLSENLENESVRVSMSLSGRLKIDVDGASFNFQHPGIVLDWVKFEGDITNLNRTVAKIMATINENEKLFDSLMWSYNNKGSLK